MSRVLEIRERCFVKRAGWVEATGMLTADAFYHGIKRGTVKLVERGVDPALV